MVQKNVHPVHSAEQSRRANPALSYITQLFPVAHDLHHSVYMNTGKTMRAFITIIILIAVLKLNGCFYGLSPEINVIKQDKAEFIPRDGSLDIFWADGRAIEQAYRQIGLIEIKGDAYSSNDELLELLKKEALKIGADAVVNVKLGYVTRISGEIVTEIFTSNSRSNEYISSTLTGVAVKYISHAER